MNRIVAIARVQSLGGRGALLWPPFIMSIAFAANLLIFASIGDLAGPQPITGGLASIYITSLIIGAVAVTQQFPFLLGLSVTRREFTAGLALWVAAQAVLYSVFLVLLQLVEHATNGWGLHVRFFGLGLVDRYAPPVQFAVYAVPLLFMTLFGAALGAVYLRWRANGVLAFTAALVVVLGGGAALIGFTGGWPAVADWLTGTSPVALIAGWPLPLVAALAAGSWLALRRANP
jgi:hypothetical protein